MNITDKTCMLAKAPRAGANMEGWVLEPKFDGHRMIATVRGGVVRMFARSGVDKTGHLPLVESRLAHLPDCVIDGEVTDPANGWGGVQEILGSSSRKSDDLVFVVFDVLEAMGKDVRGEPWMVRRKYLDLLLQHIDASADDRALPRLVTEVVVISPTFDYTPETVANMIAEGWEGGIVKNPTSKYESGRRSPNWAKIKATDTVDVVVLDAEEGQGKYAGMVGALVFGVVADHTDRIQNLRVHNGVTYGIRGRCSGMTDAERQQFTDMWDEDTLAGTVIEVAHMGIMPTGGWRHPQYKRTRTDKRPEECVA